MERKHVFLALLVVLIWGGNFVAVKFVFAEISPFLFVLIRLILTVFPLIFFLPRPKVSFSLIFWLSVFQWTLHFALLFSGIYTGVSSGIAALLLQSQVIFTIFLTALYFKTRPNKLQVIGVAVSFIGLVLLMTQGDVSSNWLGILLLTGAAIAVSITNILFRSVPREVNALSLIVWSSALAIPQAFLISLFLDGWPTMQSSFIQISWTGWLAISYTVYISALIGIATWCNLMQTSDPIKVVPFSLLVPIVAMIAGSIILHEGISWIDILASTIVLSGLMVNQLSIFKKSVVIPMEINEDVPLKKAA